MCTPCGPCGSYCGPRGACGPCGSCGPCGPCAPCGACGPCGPCGPCNPCVFGPGSVSTPSCGLPSRPYCEVPVPLPAGADNCYVSPPLMEGGIPDPRVWNNCHPPSCYPCYL